MTDLKSASNNLTAAVHCEAFYQGRIYYNIALKGAQFTAAVTDKILTYRCNKQSSEAQSTWYRLKQSSRKFPGQNTDLFFWINKVCDFSFSNSEQACLTLCRLHAAWHLCLAGLVSHWNTWHYSPLLVLIKMIINSQIPFKITTLKIQMDCFDIKRSWKRRTDWSLQQDLHMALKCDKRYEISTIFAL